MDQTGVSESDQLQETSDQKEKEDKLQKQQGAGKLCEGVCVFK